jgi:peptidoglycan/LPS O-acetylase OafA/YrhL
MKEIKSLTGLRGIAATYVMIGHIFINYWRVVDVHLNTWNNSFIQKCLVKGIAGHYLSVDVFFILSAFVLSMSYEYKVQSGINITFLKNYLVKRFARIYPIYIANILLFYLLFKPDLPVRSILRNILLLQIFFPTNYTINGVSWSLSVEWVIYFIFPFILLIKSKKWMLFFILSMLGYAYLFFFVSGHFSIPSLFDIHFIVGKDALIRGISAYLLGIAIYKIFSCKPAWIRTINKYIIYVLILIFFFIFIVRNDLFMPILLALLILGITNQNSVSKFLSSKPVYFLGLISYSLYLNHWLVFKVVEAICQKYNFSILLNRCLFALSVFLSIFISYITYKLIEMPIGKYIRKKLISKPAIDS